MNEPRKSAPNKSKLMETRYGVIPKPSNPQEEKEEALT